MDPALIARLRREVAARVGIDADLLTSAGTTIVTDPEQGADGWVSLWPIGDHVLAQVPASLLDAVEHATAPLPRSHPITADDLRAAWSGQVVEVERSPLRVLHEPAFRPTGTTDGATVRLLDASDREAFETFHDRCSRADRDEADIDIDHLAAGVLIGDRIVAVASTYVWHGFDDIGILTDPDHRRQGYGAAAASALCRELLGAPRLACYRYDEANLASQHLAASLGLVLVGTLVEMRAALHAGGDA